MLKLPFVFVALALSSSMLSWAAPTPMDSGAGHQSNRQSRNTRQPQNHQIERQVGNQNTTRNIVYVNEYGRPSQITSNGDNFEVHHTSQYDHEDYEQARRSQAFAAGRQVQERAARARSQALANERQAREQAAQARREAQDAERRARERAARIQSQARERAARARSQALAAERQAREEAAQARQEAQKQAARARQEARDAERQAREEAARARQQAHDTASRAREEAARIREQTSAQRAFIQAQAAGGGQRPNSIHVNGIHIDHPFIRIGNVTIHNRRPVSSKGGDQSASRNGDENSFVVHDGHTFIYPALDQTDVHQGSSNNQEWEYYHPDLFVPETRIDTALIDQGNQSPDEQTSEESDSTASTESYTSEDTSSSAGSNERRRRPPPPPHDAGFVHREGKEPMQEEASSSRKQEEESSSD